MPALLMILAPYLRVAVLAGAAIAAAAGWLAIHDVQTRKVERGRIVRRLAIATAKESARRLEVIDAALAHAAIAADALSRARERSDELEKEIARASAPNDSVACLDVDSLRRLHAIPGQPADLGTDKDEPASGIDAPMQAPVASQRWKRGRR